MIEVTCKDCGASNHGGNSYNTFFGMQRLHEAACSQSYSTGYTTLETFTEQIMTDDNQYDTRTIKVNGELDSKGSVL